MKGFLLDTNCVSEGSRPQPNPQVRTWLSRMDEAELYLSVLTIGEIRKGIARLPIGRRKRELEHWLEKDLRDQFGSRMLAIDQNIADRWGFVDAHARQQGRIISAIDGLLAATAIEHNLTLVTRNIRDFEAVPISTISPWEP